ncbi:hypothetical protein BO70DRAFT_315891 [Aspergillus heteromorphus CBS 117.55]|uniref:HMG box domain-containing protein n=1 Tax=Aspergillus heteromorphus CBS 117.55 TaxID=1448321 RepID=A0A317W1Y8_9EURO|nr:uncharacterized protein BO70DRAFT_315891 [Aspergillus heteromorphus CBS 117.55]PWY80646.1 hypothetical protein BO70DRAFT_315891 [Aspergillus heteromorphus CBS 117.55]
MTAATARLIRGQPPSPPQSTDGDPAPEAHRDSCGMLPSLYGHPDTFAPAGLPGTHRHGETAYDQRPSGYASPPPQYVSSGDYSRAFPLQNQMAGLQVNTPPPAADEGLVPNSLSQWGSPPSQKKVIKARVSRPTRVRRRTRKAKDREMRHRLEGPLSQLTKDMDSVPLRDMEEYVHRSIEKRLDDVRKNQGKVARPMNSFMLYRSAYADRTKKLFSQNNHQVVSEAAGDSWRLETQEIREKYERLASIEKDNHLKAHPGYKFSPAKDKKKRTGVEDGRPMMNTPDSSPALLQHRALSSSEVDSSGWESRDSTPFDFHSDHGLPREPFLPPSAWHANNHGRPHMIPSSEPTAHYLHQAMQSGLMPHVEDVRFRKSGLQDMQYVPSTSLAALPGGAHHDLLQPSNPMPGGGQLDPQLLTMQTELQSPTQLFGNSPYPGVWQETTASNCYSPVPASVAPTSVSYPAGSVYPPTMHPLDNRETWESGHETTLDGAGGEFDRWINPQGQGF